MHAAQRIVSRGREAEPKSCGKKDGRARKHSRTRPSRCRRKRLCATARPLPHFGFESGQRLLQHGQVPRLSWNDAAPEAAALPVFAALALALAGFALSDESFFASFLAALRTAFSCFFACFFSCFFESFLAAFFFLSDMAGSFLFFAAIITDKRYKVSIN